MNEPKFTPGPWEATGRRGDDWESVVYLTNKPGNEVCQVFHEEGNEDECEANTHLIAAALDLYAALKREFDRQNCTCKMLGYIGETPPCGKCKIEGVLTKATP